MRSPHRRIVLYSHDSMGLGHLRRNLLIAQEIAASVPSAAILLITGAREASAFAMPTGVDGVTLPSLRKTNGEYQSRSLDISVARLKSLREGAILAAVDAFDPDVFIADKVPRGALGELDATLKRLRARGRARCVLGLRDVLDDPAAVEREWQAAGNDQAVQDFYDAVWIYGDPRVYDLALECRFSQPLAAKLHYTGYLDPRGRLGGAASRDSDTAAAELPAGRLMLCLVGGGEDGAGLAEAFAQAELPAGTSGVIVAGPFMPPEVQRHLHAHARNQSRLRVLDFLPEPESLLRRADRVIAMGGYNSVCEVLAFGKPALIVPRVHPRREQLIRASRLRELGLLDMLHPDQLTPGALTEWLARERPATTPRCRIDFGGLGRVPFTFTAHGYDVYRRPPEDFAARAAAARAVVTVSRANAQYIVDHFGVPADRVRVISCGVDTERFQPNGARAEPPHIVCVARLVPVKNLGLLLEACAELVWRGLDFRCVVIGEGRCREQVTAARTHLRLEPVVELLGSVEQSQVLRWWQRAAVAALSSHSEGMPVSLMEAAACGAPAVATAVGGVPELIDHGVTGLVVPPSDARAMADAIERLLGDPVLRVRMGRAARLRAEQRFSVRTQVDQLCDLWARILSN